MPNKFWQTFRPASQDLTKFNTWRGGEIAVPGFLNISIPPFSITGIPWIGSSFVVLEFNGDLGQFFSLRAPVVAPVGVNFCLAIRYGSTDTGIVRYKLWQDVDERLHFPLYTGQRLPNEPFVFEIWTVESSSVCSLASAFDIYTSILLEREECCTVPTSEEAMTSFDILFAPMNPYAALPIVPSEPFA